VPATLAALPSTRAIETRSLPTSLAATHRGFAFYVAFPNAPFPLVATCSMSLIPQLHSSQAREPGRVRPLADAAIDSFAPAQSGFHPRIRLSISHLRPVARFTRPPRRSDKARSSTSRAPLRRVGRLKHVVANVEPNGSFVRLLMQALTSMRLQKVALARALRSWMQVKRTCTRKHTGVFASIAI
jgi:hypothetical protein